MYSNISNKQNIYKMNINVINIVLIFMCNVNLFLKINLKYRNHE